MITENYAAKRKLNVYLAGPLFSEAERKFNHGLKQVLTQYFHVYLPQEDGGLLVEMVKEGVPPELAARKVFDGDMRAIGSCDMFLIILDGRTVDEGAAFELGVAYTMGKPCYGLKTGPRQLLATGNNPMIDRPLQRIFQSAGELADWARQITGHSVEKKRDKEVCLDLETA